MHLRRQCPAGRSPRSPRSSLGGGSSQGVDVNCAFDLLKRLDVRIQWVVPILKLVHVVHQVSDDGFHIPGWMETQYVFGLLDADLIVSEILNMLDIEVH